MEGSNKTLTTVLVSLAAVVGGLGIVFSVGVAVQSATAPVVGQLREVLDGQRRIEVGITQAGKNDVRALMARVDALEASLRELKNNGPRAQAQPQPQAQQPQPPSEDMNRIFDLPVADSYIKGPKDAPVTITVFKDYQCPFCSRFYPAVTDAQKSFPDKVRIVVKHFPLPFHNMARPAAKAAMAAGEQGKFYEMTDLILANAAALSDDKFKELAGQAGLNMEKFLKDLKDKDAQYEKKIEMDMALGGQSDVRGTPTYFINGKKSAARTVDVWKSEIQALLKK